MIIFKNASRLKNYLNKRIQAGTICGFVPTMGALHEGHLSLIRKSRKDNDLTIVSIFVNPLQFNNPDDLRLYPQTLENDILLLDETKTDILFLPNREEMYPDHSISEKVYDLSGIDDILEGQFRPGHFQGVCRAVHRLLNIVEPDKLYLGQKDYQQVQVIKRLVALIDSKATVIQVPTEREANGLAMSSRNLRLTPDERNAAAAIYEQLIWIKNNQQQHSFAELKKKVTDQLLESGFKVEYLELAEADRLKLLTDFEPGKAMAILAAVYSGEVRLIDNVLL